MIRSMTGFGAADGAVGALRVEVEVRSVNHRFFSPSVRLPGAFSRYEADVRDALRTHVARGHVALAARVERDAAAPGRVRLDAARLAGYADAYREVATTFGAAPSVSFTELLRLPGVVLAEDEEGAPAASADDDVTERAALLAVVDAAAARLTAARAAEGDRIAAVLRERVGVVAAAFDRIAERAPERLVEQRDRLRQAVRDLTGGTTLSEERVAQEIALLVDRVDVSEEIDRFRAHVAAFRQALEAPDAEPVGKRLGFLLQEMLRETNTTGSKANDSAVLREVLLVKEELERIREQVENVE